MIDTLKIVSAISKEIYLKIMSASTIKTSYSCATGKVFYKIVNNSLEGSYGSSLSVRIGDGVKYRLNTNHYIEIEGSYHKLVKGYNSHNGFYNLVPLARELIKMVENAYNIQLPHIKRWFIQRIDIAICFDLATQENVIKYINNLSLCTYSSRKPKFYTDESIYLSGSTTTVKIYNKLLEFKKHDIGKLLNTEFNLVDHMKEIQGLIRFECEIKKRKLQCAFNKKNIRLYSITYSQLREIWEDEFRKFLKLSQSDMKIVSEKEDVKQRLCTIYKNVRAKNLYNFYLLIKMQGLQEMKRNTNKSMYYQNISDLKKAGIDFTQKLELNLEDNKVNFNPFSSEEIL